MSAQRKLNGKKPQNINSNCERDEKSKKNNYHRNEYLESKATEEPNRSNNAKATTTKTTKEEM